MTIINNSNPAVQFYPSALISYDKDGTPDCQILEKIPEKTETCCLVVNDPVWITHYFHFTEIILTVFGSLTDPAMAKYITEIIWGKQSYSHHNQNRTNESLIELMFPNAENNTDTLPKERINVIFISRKLSRTTINKLLEKSILTYVKEQRWNYIRNLLEKKLGLARRVLPNLRESGIATYIRRKPMRELSDQDITSIAGFIENLGLRFNYVDFAVLSWEQQVRISYNTDLLIGAHGNGLTNALWLPPHSCVIEFFGHDMHAYDYQVFTEITGCRYFGIETGENRIIWSKFNRKMNYFYKDPNLLHTNVPFDLFKTCIYAWLMEIDQIKSYIE
ncbi:MAG: glycosyltransferase family 61 protein [Spirochaetales bacterium]|nr:glycosyltransferase family 61 protein [Spirochaetales bacterium]